MPDREKRTISILTAQGPGMRKSMFDESRSLTARCTRITCDKLKESFEEFVQLLREVVQGVPRQCGGYDVDSLTFALALDASGKISLVGELAAGMSSGITITLRKGSGSLESQP